MQLFPELAEICKRVIRECEEYKFGGAVLQLPRIAISEADARKFLDLYWEEMKGDK